MTIRKLFNIILIVVFLSWYLPCEAQDTTKKKPYNVLFISIDDLNDWTGFLDGNAQSATPNMDTFAKESMNFMNAQCPASVCNPSRTAIMSGVLPTTSGVYGNKNFFRDSPVLKDIKTIPQYLADYGYSTLSSGKIFHYPYGEWADEQSWQKFRAAKGTYGKVIGKQPGFMSNGIPKGEILASFDWGPTDLKPKETKDVLTMKWGVEQLDLLVEKPFFMALGITKPHLKWEVPKEFFDKFPLEDIKLPEVNIDDFDDIPDGALKPRKDYYTIKKFGKEKELVQAYLAAINYADYCVGVILDALNNSPYKDNTIVIIWGDHGWHLGEKLRYGKATLWEEATRVPLLIKVPQMTISGSSTNTPVNLIDLYPTILELCGIEANSLNEGNSLVPILKNPKLKRAKPSLTTMGYKNHSLRDERYRFIQYRNGNQELYDHQKDPLGWNNLALDPVYASIIKNFKNHLPKINAKPSVKREKHTSSED